jgi:hypothetical protein
MTDSLVNPNESNVLGPLWESVEAQQLSKDHTRENQPGNPNGNAHEPSFMSGSARESQNDLGRDLEMTDHGRPSGTFGRPAKMSKS